eukprot:1297999-Rhodomonas_salina.2
MLHARQQYPGRRHGSARKACYLLHVRNTVRNLLVGIPTPGTFMRVQLWVWGNIKFEGLGKCCLEVTGSLSNSQGGYTLKINAIRAEFMDVGATKISHGTRVPGYPGTVAFPQTASTAHTNEGGERSEPLHLCRSQDRDTYHPPSKIIVSR